MIDPDNLYTYKAEIVRIVDGDTLDITLDLGFRFKWESIRVRLLSSHGGVDTPELNSIVPSVRTLAKAAKARTEELAPVGSAVLVKTELDKFDGFGRILANIINASGQNVGDTLLSEGLASVWTRGK